VPKNLVGTKVTIQASFNLAPITVASRPIEVVLKP